MGHLKEFRNKVVNTVFCDNFFLVFYFKYSKKEKIVFSLFFVAFSAKRLTEFCRDAHMSQPGRLCSGQELLRTLKLETTNAEFVQHMQKKMRH